MPRLSIFLLFFICLVPAAVGQQTLPGTDFGADQTVYDFGTGIAVARGNARLAYRGVVLLADEITYHDRTHLAVARGNIRIQQGARLMLADEVAYNLRDESFEVSNLRVGEGSVYLQADAASGSPAAITMTDASVSYRRPGPFAPTLRAARLVYAEDGTVTTTRARAGIGLFQPIPLPSFIQKLDQPLFSNLSGNVGYRSSLGAYVSAGVEVPVRPGLRLGAEAGLYSKRGLMAGPAGSYEFGDATRSTQGSLSSGYIRDLGDRLTDILGDPVPKSRGFLQWEHRQRLGERVTLNGQVNYWSDSEIIRDFRFKDFALVQTPDTWLEAAHTGRHHVLSLFSRFQPNRFHAVQQRLPELRFDLLPMELALGVHQRAQVSAAVLREEPPGGGAELRSDRFDAYYGLTRSFTPREWLSIQPVAGGRVTHYARAMGGRDDYTRTLGELGLDAELRASGVYAYKNERWRIDGLRHLITPRISYRYLPGGDKGRAYIPPIDRNVFSTYLQPLGLGDRRSIDDLRRNHTLRVALDNRLQTRDPAYGSRDLAALNLAADLRFDQPAGQRTLSSIHAELRLTPARWMEFALYQNLDPHNGRLGELNTALILNDGNARSLRLATHYLRNDIQEYSVDYHHRFNEVWQGIVELHYDARRRRFVEQTYGVRQTVDNLWFVQYEVSFLEGARRESAFRFNISVDLATF